MTKRRFGDYNDALADLDGLFEELMAELNSLYAGTKPWLKLKRLVVNSLKERLTI